MCLPEAIGGLNIIDLKLWNKSAVTKHLYVIAIKKDSVWIKWIHSVYIKNKRLDSLIIPKNAAWVVRKILATRELVLRLQRIQGDLMSRLQQLQHFDGFSIKRIYKQISPQYPRVSWKNMILQLQLHPRYKFIL